MKATPFVTYSALVCASILLFPVIASAATYRVGPGEQHTRVSQVTSRLRPGDVVEVTGDMMDSFVVRGPGGPGNPVIIRGITKVEGGQIMRPQIRPSSSSADFIVRCEGAGVVIEGLEFTGFKGQEHGRAAVILAGRNIVLRNCYIHHNIRALYTDPATTADVRIAFCEFDSNGYAKLGAMSLFSSVPNARVTVEHCYFHDNAGTTLLRCGFARNVVRYNWFENPYKFGLQITTAAFPDIPSGRDLAERLLPAHSDIIGNVFLTGWSSTVYALLQLGGSDDESPGPEGDFNIAHNCFIARRGLWPQVHILTHGNVDRISAYNNVFIEARAGGCKLYDRELEFEVPRSRVFIERRGGADPEVAGSHNWISRTTLAIPDGFKDTILGTNPLFHDFVRRDFHPASGSPLAGAGLWPLPDGRIVGLFPEFEPRRGIPANLEARRRNDAAAPSIGPFEVAQRAPGFEDDSADIVLGAGEDSGTMQWQLNYGLARRMALEHLNAGRPLEALQCARMQFILSPMSQTPRLAAISSVKEMLAAVDGDGSRGNLFEEYVLYGATGEDGNIGTEDDLEDVLGDVPLEVFRRPNGFYEEFDAKMDSRKAMNRGIIYYTKWWQERWFQTEKMLTRVEGGEFEEAFGLLVPLLVEAVKRPAAVSERGRLWRNQNLLDRLREGLCAIVKSRTNSLAGVRESMENYMDFARFGPAGADETMGTVDDVDMRGQTRRGPHAEKAAVDPEVLDALKAMQLDLSVQASVARRLEAISETGARIRHKMHFIADEAGAGYPNPFIHSRPDPFELYRNLKELLAANVVRVAGLRKEQTLMLESYHEKAIHSADQAALAAYDLVMAEGRGSEAASTAGTFLAAYVLGTHDESTFPSILALLADRVAPSQPASFLVEECCYRLGAPFAAGEALDAIERSNGHEWSEGERERLLALVEKQQFETIEASSDRLSRMYTKETAEYKVLVGRCEAYLKLFPAGPHAAEVKFYSAFCRYAAEDYKDAIKDVREFVVRHPESDLMPNALFIEGLAELGVGNTDTAVRKFVALADGFPKSKFAPQALYTAGHALFSALKRERARELFIRVVDFYPRDTHARKARAFLVKLESTASPK